MTKSLYSSRYEMFRTLLVDARRCAGLSQGDVAERLSRPQSYISKVERGERRLDVIEFLELASVLRIDPLEFLSLLLTGDQGKGPNEDR
jgi:transcriptional regulator with XRE-family HTH domain